MPPKGSAAAPPGADYCNRLVRRGWDDGYVESCTLLRDVPTGGGGGGGDDAGDGDGAVRLWRVRYETRDDEELLTDELVPLLLPGFRRVRATGASQDVLVARKVAELPRLNRNGAAPPAGASSRQRDTAAAARRMSGLRARCALRCADIQ